MFKNFDQIANLIYGLSEKSDGSMKVFGDEVNKKSRADFFSRQSMGSVVTAGLAHGNSVYSATASDAGRIVPETDALVTNLSNLFLTVTVADCFPVYFFNKISNTVGIAHSGWYGTANNIIVKSIKTIGGDPANIIAGIGPGIQACHFEVREDVLGKFQNYEEAIINRDKKIFIDLPNIISRQLIEAGLEARNIENYGECTFCQKEKYFSFRRDKPKSVEAMVAYIGLNSF